MQSGFSFSNFIADLVAVFVFVLWLWLLITVIGDLFRRRDLSGGRKLIWLIVLIVLPYVGVFAYLLTQGSSMAERDEQRQHVREELHRFVGYSVADELAKLLRLKDAGAISKAEYARLRARALG